MSGVLAIIGGSGLYDVESLEDVEERWVSTPYGAPSDAVIRERSRVSSSPRRSTAGSTATAAEVTTTRRAESPRPPPSRRPPGRS